MPFTNKAFFILFLLLSQAIIAKENPKSWARSMRNALMPLLSQRNIHNWNRLVETVEDDPDEQQQPPAHNQQSFHDQPVQTPHYIVEQSSTSFASIAGGVPQEIYTFMDMVRYPQRYISYGIKPPRGILLVGPPGCGKTLLARAIAGEADCGFLYASATDFIEIYVGTGPLRVRQLFDAAKKHCKSTNGKAIIFIDEIDALGSRAQLAGSDSESRRTLNELLTQMDGFSTTEDILVLAATNNPRDIDPALKRAGRFDTIIEIPLPNLETRKAVLAHYLSNLPFNKRNVIDMVAIAKATENFNNADLKELIRLASLQAVQEDERVSQQHLLDAVKKIQAQKKH